MVRSSIVVFAWVLAAASLVGGCSAANGTGIPDSEAADAGPKPSTTGATVEAGASLPGIPASGPSKSSPPPPAAPPIGATLKSCCKLEGKLRGKCVPKSMVPAMSLPLLANDDDETCKDGIEVCAPTESLDPAFKPAVCAASSFLIGSYTGVCLSDCLDFGIDGIGYEKGNCGTAQTCAPCVKDGKPTGAPGCPKAM